MHYDLISYFSYLAPLHCNPPFLSSKMGCRDCYISPAQAACWGQAPLRFALLCFIFSCDQAALRALLSVCPSIRLSHLFHNVPVIVSSWNFQELLPLTKVISLQKVKFRDQSSRSQMSKQILPQFGHSWTVIPVWIHRWLWSDALSLQ